MAKWADYVITCVNYTSDGSKISTVGVHVDNGTTLETRHPWHRAQVVRELDDGKTFVTATRNAEGNWTKGASVEPSKVGAEWFIQTVANNTAKDNLGSLPSCT